MRWSEIRGVVHSYKTVDPALRVRTPTNASQAGRRSVLRSPALSECPDTASVRRRTTAL